MSKFRKVFGLGVKSCVVVLQAVAAIFVPAKFADAATRDDGAHRDKVAGDEGLRFELDQRADAALAQSEAYVQVAQADRSAEDVVQDSVQLLNSRGVDVGALLQAGSLDEVVQSLVESGEVEGAGGEADYGSVVEDLDTGDIQEIITQSS